MTASQAPTHNIAGQDERVHAMLKQVGAEFATASDFLSEYGISTELAQQAASVLNEPLLACYELQEKLQTSASTLLQSVVVGYIKSVAKESSVTGLWRVMRPDADSTLEYTIALKENTLENRALFREFRLDYEESGFGTLVPLIFHLIPEKFSGNVLMSEEVAFA